MRIVFLSYSDFKGGASIAAYSIFKAINKKNFFFLTVEKKFKGSISIYNISKKLIIFVYRIIEKFFLLFLKKKEFHQSLNILNVFIKKKIESYNPDIINLHWINRSMISLNEINQLKSKLVLSLHDMWFFSSTEHYFINENKNDILSQYCWKIKKQIIYKKNVYFIVHNKWMFEQITARHPTLKNKVYLSSNYPIDTNLFKPRNKNFLRKKYNLPLDKKIIFFSAQDIKDKRKGFKYFTKIVKKLSKDKNLYFLSLGGNTSDLEFSKNHKHINFISNKKSSELYSLSDIFLCTSLIDNLPLTVLEGISSGNLVISFDNGGTRNVLKNVGYIFKVSQMSNLIKFIKNVDKKLIKKKSILSRKFALKNFNQKKIGKKYLRIFNEINKIKN